MASAAISSVMLPPRRCCQPRFSGEARHDRGLQIVGIAFGQVAEAGVAQRALTDLRAVGGIGGGRGERGPRGFELVAQAGGEIAAQTRARGVDGFGVDGAALLNHGFGEHGFGGQVERFGGERGVARSGRRRARGRRRRRRRRESVDAGPPAAMPASRTRVARRWPASQRLNASVSCAIRWRELGVGLFQFSSTGAEKPRSSEGTGRAGTSSKTKRLRGLGQREHALGADAPSARRRAAAAGRGRRAPPARARPGCAARRRQPAARFG